MTARADILSFIDNEDFYNRNRESSKLPHNFGWMIKYLKGKSLEKKRNLFAIVPAISICTGESNSVVVEVNKSHKNLYPEEYKSFYNRYFEVDIDRIYEEEEVKTISSWLRIYNSRKHYYGGEVDETFTFEDLQFFYEFVVFMEIGESDLEFENFGIKISIENRDEAVNIRIKELERQLKELKSNV